MVPSEETKLIDGGDRFERVSCPISYIHLFISKIVALKLTSTNQNFLPASFFGPIIVVIKTEKEELLDV